MELRLNPEQVAIRRVVRDFVNREVKPIALDHDRITDPEQRLPWAVLDKASQLGLRALALSRELGGSGADTLTSCIVTEELSAGDVGVAATLAQTSFLAHRWFDEVMSSEQRDRFLPQFLADDRYHLALAWHEPDTDLGYDYFERPAPGTGLQTKAVREGSGDWVIDGSKNFITNGTVAKLFAVQARVDPSLPGSAGVRSFLMPRDTPGLTVREHDKMGRRLGSNGELFFDNCRVPAENLLGKEGSHPSEGSAADLGRSPVYPQAWALGIGRAAYEAALEYTKVRVQGNKPIVEHQAVGLVLAEMATSLQAARAILWKAAWGADHPEAYDDGSLPDLPLAAIARIYVSETVFKVASQALQLFGGMGIMNELPMQKYLRDAMVVQHGAFGTNDVARLRIAELVAGYRRAAVSAR